MCIRDSGTGSFIAFMAVSVVMGLSTGVQAIVARRVGEGNTKDVATALNGALVVAVISGLILSTLYWLSAETIFSWVNKDPDVLAMGVPYIELRVCLLYTSPSPRDGLLSRMPSSA